MTAYVLPNATDPLQPILERIRDLFSLRLNHGLDAADQTIVAVLAGSQVVIADCCPGYAWVRAARAFPSTSFPTPATTMVGCPELTFAAEVELGIARCSATINTDGTADVDDLEDEAVLIGRDRSILFQTVIADIATDDQLGVECELTLGQWSPIPTSGQCMGGTITFTIAYEQCIDSLGA